MSKGSLGFFDEGFGPLDLALGVAEADGLAARAELSGLSTGAEAVAVTTGGAAETAGPELGAELSGA